MVSYIQLMNLVKITGDVVIRANDFTLLELVSLAKNIKYGKLIIKKADILSYLDMNTIASANPGKVSFDFTDL